MTKKIKPEVDMDATMHVGTDMYPCTITKVSATNKTITVRDDITKKEKKSGMYSVPRIFTLRKNGQYIQKGNPMSSCISLEIGKRQKYKDPSF